MIVFIELSTLQGGHDAGCEILDTGLNECGMKIQNPRSKIKPTMTHTMVIASCSK